MTTEKEVDLLINSLSFFNQPEDEEKTPTNIHNETYLKLRNARLRMIARICRHVQGETLKEVKFE
jgi:hypothetical protein